MARDGYLILDSDLHMMEPGDLWARYLDEPWRANPPRFFGGQQQQLAESKEDKANTDSIMGMEVQGLAIPAHNMQQGATVSSRELRRRSRARHPHFNVARARGYRCALDPDRDGHRGDRRRGHVRHARPADPVPRRSRARLRRRPGARLQQLGRRLLQDRPDAAQIRRADRDARYRPGGRRGAPLRQGIGRGRGHRHAQPGQRPASARRCRRAAVGRARRAQRADRLPPDRQHRAEGRCRAALCRARQFPPDRACDPQSRSS